jgi:hypothetical protein
MTGHGAVSILRNLLLAGCILAGGCIQWVEDHPPVAPTRLPAITFHFSIPAAAVNERMNIARTGEVYAYSRQRGTAHGLLTDAQVAQLQKIFLGWDHLPATYPSVPDGPFYVISYGGHAVTGGTLASAPDSFRKAVGELGRILDSLLWKRP